mgnify:CR=1 FL=1
MSICTVLDNNTQKFQDILQDNAAASRAVAWSGNNFDGNNVDTKVNKALSFIDKLAKSTPQTKAQADKIIKELHDRHLVYQVKTNAGIHYGTKFPEIVGFILKNKKNVIFSAYGNISDTPYDGKYNYLYSQKTDTTYQIEIKNGNPVSDTITITPAKKIYRIAGSIAIAGAVLLYLSLFI